MRVRRGFALLEAVVALLVIGLAAAGALDLFAAHLRAAAKEPALLTAAALAQDRMAALRLLDATGLQQLPDSLARGQFALPFSAFRWRAGSVRSAEEQLYEIHVEITWNDGSYALTSRQSAASLGGRP
jgi:prepilin-type N-terminal cleavage/methylation domain-containing protein